MATATDTEDIVRGEKRWLRVKFPDGTSFPTGAATWALSMTVTQTKGGAALFTVTFGAGEYASEGWNVAISTTNSALLSYGKVTYAKVLRTDAGFEQALGSMTVTVG